MGASEFASLQKSSANAEELDCDERPENKSDADGSALLQRYQAAIAADIVPEFGSLQKSSANADELDSDVRPDNKSDADASASDADASASDAELNASYAAAVAPTPAPASKVV